MYQMSCIAPEELGAPTAVCFSGTGAHEKQQCMILVPGDAVVTNRIGSGAVSVRIHCEGGLAGVVGGRNRRRTRGRRL